MAPPRSPRSPNPCTPRPGNAWPVCASPMTGSKPCSRCCASSGCCPAASPTVTYENTSNRSSDVLRGPSAAGREPTTCAGCDTTASSNESRTATATASPPRATVEPCSCPRRITGFCATDSPRSPQNQPAPQDSAPPTAPTKQLSMTYSHGPRSQHEQHSNLTHPQRQTRLKSSSSAVNVAFAPLVRCCQAEHTSRTAKEGFLRDRQDVPARLPHCPPAEAVQRIPRQRRAMIPPHKDTSSPSMCTSPSSSSCGDGDYGRRQQSCNGSGSGTVCLSPSNVPIKTSPP